MRTPIHLEELPHCPFLPMPEVAQTAAAMRQLGAGRGVAFYEAALKCGHSLWLQGLPAQAMLQINRAFGCDLTGDEPVLRSLPLPYAAMAWIMEARTEEQFIGNPRRHFQHLATRMVEPRKALRTWRAWACWWMSRQIFPDFPADELQLERENIIEPEFAEIGEHLAKLGHPGERELWERVVAQLGERK